MMTKVPHLRKFYPFHIEDDFRLVLKDYLGELHASDSWVVVVRCTLNLHSTEKVPCSIHIWAPLEKLVYRLIDNDTLEDIPLGFVENNVAYLSKNKEGYTLCVYGTTAVDTVEWRLRSIGVGELALLHVCQGDGCRDTSVQPPQQHQQTLHGFYVPNKHCLVTRCSLSVYSDVTVLLRLHLSDPSVLCSFTIIDGSGCFITNQTGLGHIIIPILKLKGGGESELELVTQYQVEVRVLGNSWPLSQEQCQALLYYKEHWPDTLLSTSTNNNVAEGSVSNYPPLSPSEPANDPDFEFYKKVQKPSWSLTVVTDFEQVTPVILQLDMSLYNSLQQFKAQWQDPSHCKQLRQDFLNKPSDEEVEDLSEDFLFHLKAKKTEQLTQSYGQTAGSLSVPDIGDSLKSSYSSGYSVLDFLSVTGSTKNQSQSNETKEISLIHSPRSSKTDQKVEPFIPRSDVSEVVSARERQSSSRLVTEDQTSVLFQQAGWHNALESMKIKHMKLHEELKEVYLMRNQLLDEIRLREAKPKKGNEEDKVKNKPQSPDSKKKTSLKDSKKAKTKK